MNNTYIFNSLQIDNAEKFQKYYSCMSDYRRSKIDRMKMEKDKLLSLSAGILLDSCLKKLGLRERSMEYALGKNEKPFLQMYRVFILIFLTAEPTLFAAFLKMKLAVILRK